MYALSEEVVYFSFMSSMSSLPAMMLEYLPLPKRPSMPIPTAFHEISPP